jgi:TatD DNase family protein
MAQFIDTHSHLYDNDFISDLPEVIERAKESKVLRCILPAIDKSCHQSLMDTASGFPGTLFPSAGLHPTSVGENWEEELEFVYETAAAEKYIAIGEIGMDGYWSKDFLNQQAIVFEKQIELAVRLNLPVIIHSREATEEIFKVLERCRHLNVKGVFHAFSGSYETFCRIQKTGNFLVGIGGVVTFKKASLAETVKKIGLDNIVLETDAPWLAPAPFRGKRNEPSYIGIIAQKLSELLEKDIDEVAEKTTGNAQRMFNL